MEKEKESSKALEKNESTRAVRTIAKKREQARGRENKPTVTANFADVIVLIF